MSPNQTLQLIYLKSLWRSLFCSIRHTHNCDSRFKFAAPWNYHTVECQAHLEVPLATVSKAAEHLMEVQDHDLAALSADAQQFATCGCA